MAEVSIRVLHYFGPGSTSGLAQFWVLMMLGLANWLSCVRRCYVSGLCGCISGTASVCLEAKPN